MKQKCEIRINQEALDGLVKEQEKAKAMEAGTRGGFPTFTKDVNTPQRKPRGPK